MKIYQLHKYSGKWEDFEDRIIGSYLRKQRAEEEKAKAETKEKAMLAHSKKCDGCPFLEYDFDSLDDLLLEYPDYCDMAELEEIEHDIVCKNCYTHWDESAFKIMEVEVEE